MCERRRGLVNVISNDSNCPVIIPDPFTPVTFFVKVRVRNVERLPCLSTIRSGVRALLAPLCAPQFGREAGSAKNLRGV